MMAATAFVSASFASRPIRARAPCCYCSWDEPKDWTKKCERRDDARSDWMVISFGSASKFPLKKKNLRKPARRPARFPAPFTYYSFQYDCFFWGYLPPAEGFMYPPSAGEIPKKNKNNRTGNCSKYP